MQFLPRRSLISTLALCALGAWSAFSAMAQDYPNKPIRIIAPFPTGTGPDANTREIAQELTKVFGQTVVVENRPGASNMIGMEAGAKAAPDGYTLVLGFDGTLVINPHVFPKVPFDTLKDFAPVTLATNGNTLTVSSSGGGGSGWGTTGNAGADTSGADAPATVIGLANNDGVVGVKDPLTGNITVNGQYGVLTIEPNGDYTYVRNAGSPGDRLDVFRYTIVDADGDAAAANLTIKIGNTGSVLEVPAVEVKEEGLPARAGEPEGSKSADNSEIVDGAFAFKSVDGLQKVARLSAD